MNVFSSLPLKGFLTFVGAQLTIWCVDSTATTTTLATDKFAKMRLSELANAAENELSLARIINDHLRSFFKA